MATKKTPEAKAEMVELKLTHSLGRKWSLENYGGPKYENLEVHLSQGETWLVEGMSEEEIEDFREERYISLNERLNALLEAEEDEMLNESGEA